MDTAKERRGLGLISGSLFFLPERSEERRSAASVKIPYTGYQNLPYILTMDILREALANGILEQAAVESDPELYGYILKAVTEGYSYEYLKGVLEMPCSRDYYYDKYRKFFWCLSRKP